MRILDNDELDYLEAARILDLARSRDFRVAKSVMLAERYALLSTWAGLADSEANPAGWMKLAAAVRG